MINPAEHLCLLNIKVSRLNMHLRDCNKENKEEIHKICVEIHNQVTAINYWAVHSGPLTTIEE